MHAIEEAIFAGVPVNVTLLFSRDHYLAAAYLRGIERRIEAGLNPRLESVASVFVSRGDGLAAQLPKEGAESFVKSWEEMTDVVAKKVQAFK